MAMREQCRLRLALRAGDDAQHVLRGVVVDVGVADLDARRYAQNAETLRDLCVLHQAAADECDLALELRGQIDQQLDAIDARRKRRDDELALGAGEQLLEARRGPRSPAR